MSEIRISSNHRELHGAIFVLQGFCLVSYWRDQITCRVYDCVPVIKISGSAGGTRIKYTFESQYYYNSYRYYRYFIETWVAPHEPHKWNFFAFQGRFTEIRIGERSQCVRRGNILFSWLQNHFAQYQSLKSFMYRIYMNHTVWIEDKSLSNKYILIDHVKKHSLITLGWKGDPKPSAISWQNASVTCESQGGTLPVLFSRQDQDELIAVIKLLTDLLPMQLVYIGITTKRFSRVTSSHQLQVHC